MTRLILYNIQYFAGTRGNIGGYLQFWKMFVPPKYLDYVIANELKKLNPDILGLVEIDIGSIRAKRQNKVTFFKDFLEFKGAVERVKYTNKGFSRLFNSLPIIKKQANAIVSKEKISEIKYHQLNNGTKRMVIEATLNTPKRLKLLLLHLSLGKKSRTKQLKQLVEIVKKIEEPLIVMGDFNIFNGMNEIEDLLKNTKLDYYPHEKKIMTQPTNKPSKSLDLILTSKEIEVKEYKVLDFQYSDHLPVMIDFNIKH